MNCGNFMRRQENAANHKTFQQKQGNYSLCKKSQSITTSQPIAIRSITTSQPISTATTNIIYNYDGDKNDAFYYIFSVTFLSLFTGNQSSSSKKNKILYK